MFMNQFNNTKYTRWYYHIIQKRAILDKDSRGEIHHIIPRSLGGDDSPDNLVKLTGHDHAWCHWLLTKMTSGSDKVSMIYAFNMMGVYGEHMERQSSYAIVRAYEKNRLEWSKNHSDTMKEQFENGRVAWNKGLDMKDDPRCKGGVKNRGKKRDPKASEQAAAKLRGRKQSEETSEKKRKSMTGLVRGPMSDSEKKKRSDASIGISKPSGFSEGCVERVKGNISVNRDGIEKRIKQPQLQFHIDNGWILGGLPRKKKQIS
jgi:hypothetical protein